MPGIKYIYLEQRPVVAELSGRTRIINGLYIVNEEYYDWLSNFTWMTSDNGYALTNLKINGRNNIVRMHRLLMDAQPGQLVDHEDRNKLNNVMSNLRFSNKSLNGLNTDRSDNAKLYTFDKVRGKWQVQRQGKQYGRFDTEAEAKVVAEIIKDGGTYTKPVIRPTHCRHGHVLDEAYFLSIPKRCRQCVLINGRASSLRAYYKHKQMLPTGDR